MHKQGLLNTITVVKLRVKTWCYLLDQHCSFLTAAKNPPVFVCSPLMVQIKRGEELLVQERKQMCEDVRVWLDRTSCTRVKRFRPSDSVCWVQGPKTLAFLGGDINWLWIRRQFCGPASIAYCEGEGRGEVFFYAAAVADRSSNDPSLCCFWWSWKKFFLEPWKDLVEI